jgi:hypothetical protein
MQHNGSSSIDGARFKIFDIEHTRIDLLQEWTQTSRLRLAELHSPSMTKSALAD